MNRFVVSSITDVNPGILPPARSEGRTRILFLTTDIMGFRTLADHLVSATQDRDDVDASHVRLQAPTWAKVLGKAIPHLSSSGWDFTSYRHLLLWRHILRGWFRKILPPDRFDVIHITTQGNAFVAADERPAGWPPFVVQIDATGLGEVREFGYSELARRPFVAAERKIYNSAAYVACWSNWAAESVRADYGIAGDRVTVARPAVDIPPIGRNDVRRDGPIRLAFVGNNWFRKGGDRLLRWHQSRWKDSAELHIFGSRITPDPTAVNVTWHGPTNRERLLTQILPTMDIMVIPTRQDTLLLAALEASACGLPVVSSRMAGLRDVVVDDHTGYLCSPANEEEYIEAVERLMKDEALRRRMGEEGRAFVMQEWNPERCYKDQLDRLVTLARSPRS